MLLFFIYRKSLAADSFIIGQGIDIHERPAFRIDLPEINLLNKAYPYIAQKTPEGDLVLYDCLFECGQYRFTVYPKERLRFTIENRDGCIGDIGRFRRMPAADKPYRLGLNKRHRSEERRVG